MKYLITIIALVCLCYPTFAQQRGFTPVQVNIDNQLTTLYSQSHALVIGVSTFTNGWPNLPGVKTDVAEVKTALELNGFNVVVVMDPNKVTMDQAFTDFIAKYGQNVDNRLVFYYAGHGHTLKASYGEILGYIVPTDAPNPNYGEAAFQSKAMEMAQVEIYAKRIQSKHALFLFDACFSGSLFATSRAVPEIISYKTKQPVRQFITSGDANELVPDVSIFRQQFVEAITTNYADTNGDGYLTGSELGERLQTNVINYSRGAQHPQFGKIRNPALDKGDFVFVIGSNTTNTSNSSDVPSLGAAESLATYGSLELTTEIGGQLYLDGNLLGTVTANSKVPVNKVLTGSHNLEIKGTENWTGAVTVSNGSVTKTTIASTIKKPKDQLFLDMVYVPGGSFIMGGTRDDEKPAHQVTISDFEMSRTEVTQAQWRKIMGTDPSYNKGCDLCPVEQVTWNDAQAFIAKLNNIYGIGHRLPTEAEWEFAARGGHSSSNIYAGSNNIDSVGWYIDNSSYETQTVGQKQANELGLYDMCGNVYEWCSDWYGDRYYANSSVYDPKGPITGDFRVLRGGSWQHNAISCNVAYRTNGNPDIRGSNDGFRVVREL